jgi:hypothetical protein
MTPTIVATLAAITAVGGYALACWVVPFGKHQRCDGKGTRTALLSPRLVPCRGCWGSGRKLRIGRRVWNYFAAMRREAMSAARVKDGIR